MSSTKIIEEVESTKMNQTIKFQIRSPISISEGDFLTNVLWCSLTNELYGQARNQWLFIWKATNKYQRLQRFWKKSRLFSRCICANALNIKNFKWFFANSFHYNCEIQTFLIIITLWREFVLHSAVVVRYTLYNWWRSFLSKLLFTEKCKKWNINRSTTFSFTISEIIYCGCFLVCILIYIYQHIQNDFTYMQCRSSLTLAPQNAYRVPPNGDLYKTFSAFMLHLEAKWPSKQISSLQTQFWQNQARSQVLMLWRGQNKFLGGKDFCFYYMLKNKFFWTHLGRTVARKFSILGLHVCAEGLDILKIYF